MRRALAVALVTALAWCISCDAPTSGGTQTTNGLAYLACQVDSIVVHNSNDFGFRLLREVTAGGACSNELVSPLSISMATGLILNGARGATRDEIAATLGYEALTDTQINQSYRRILDVLYSADPSVELIVANSLWCREGFAVKQSYIDVNRLYLDALVRTLDFSLPTAADTINLWVSGETNQRINSLIPPPIDPMVVLIALNTLYLNAPWTKTFYEVRPDSFQVDSGNVPCAMMKLKARVNCCVTDSFSAVELPYGNRQFSMLVVLPSLLSSTEQLMEDLTPEVWHRWLDLLHMDSAFVYLPAYQYSCDYDLKQVLKNLGMSLVFGGGDLSGIAPGLFVSDAMHRSFIAVDRERTEVAAATAYIVAKGVSPTPPVVVSVDRPFLFAIMENRTGTVLFIGRVCVPSPPPELPQRP